MKAAGATATPPGPPRGASRRAARGERDAASAPSVGRVARRLACSRSRTRGSCFAARAHSALSSLSGSDSRRRSPTSCGGAASGERGGGGTPTEVFATRHFQAGTLHAAATPRPHLGSAGVWRLCGGAARAVARGELRRRPTQPDERATPRGRARGETHAPATAARARRLRCGQCLPSSAPVKAATSKRGCAAERKPPLPYVCTRADEQTSFD